MDTAQKRLEEFKTLIDTGREFFSFWMKGFAFYVTISGLIVKFMFDSEPNSTERYIFYYFGLLIQMKAILATSIGGIYYRRIASRCNEIGEEIQIPNLYFPGPITMVSIFLFFMVITFIISIVFYEQLIGGSLK